MAAPVWFITGTSNGFGLLLSLKVLAAGHQVIATIRDFKRSAAAVKSIEQAGGNVIQMDMTEPRQTIIQKIQDAEKKFGPIEYLVNNAGYSLLGPIESFTESEAEQQIKTNVFGPLYAIQAVQPGMRARRSGTIVNFSSVAGQDANPSCGLYSASKFGLEGLSEVLSKEMKEFGVSVLIVEPGAFRTNFLGAKVVSNTVAKEYEGTAVGTMVEKFGAADGKQPGDPQKAVDIVFEVATGQGAAGHLKGKILRLPLGKDAFARIQTKLNAVQQDLDNSQEIGTTTDLDE
jgi:NAD(P)-dependent dehydrogenase (short-subunit alcohol dehydrogenase family)